MKRRSSTKINIAIRFKCFFHYLLCVLFVVLNCFFVVLIDLLSCFNVFLGR
jgi:hypothetical protein